MTAWFALLVAAFAIIDPWAVLGRGAWDPNRAAMIVATSAGIAGLLAVVSLWLRHYPPPSHWANLIAVSVGVAGMARPLCHLVIAPDPLRVQALAVLIIAAGCVMLSVRWFVLFLCFVIAMWYAVAIGSGLGDWETTVLMAVSSVAVSAAVFAVRRRSAMETLAARVLDADLQRELGKRIRFGEILAAVSTRFLTLPRGEFESAVAETLQELGQALHADHVFICRIDLNPARTSATYEWAADGVEMKRPLVQNVPLMDLAWFWRKLTAGESVQIPDVILLPDEAAAERESLTRLGAAAFAAVPLIRDRATPWGYVGLAHDSRPTIWSPEEMNLLSVVGGIFLSTLERQRAETAVRRSEARFRSLFDANIIGVFFADIYGRITEANDAFLAVTGYDATDLPLRWDDLSPQEWRQHDEAAVLRLLKDGVDHPWEKEFIRKDGRRIPILIGGAVLSHDRGECVSFVLDLSERKEADRTIQQLNAELERAARLATMGEMAAGLAHEVHQPLAAIANYASGAKRRLEGGRLPPEDLDHLFSEISMQCDRAGAVTRNVRDFVRGRRPGRRPVDVNRTMRECLQLARFDLRRVDAVAEVSLDESSPFVMTDPTQLTQILLNLILNAVQAMELVPPPRALTLSTRCFDDQFVEMVVTDTGPGISSEARGQVFEQFFTTKAEGLGMGLAIARSIAESHGGSLTLQSSETSGATFVLRLPVAVRPTDATSGPEEAIADAAPSSADARERFRMGP